MRDERDVEDRELELSCTRIPVELTLSLSKGPASGLAGQCDLRFAANAVS